MRVFVTGASGFVGSAIVKELLQNGHHVLGLARSEKSVIDVKAAGAAVHRGDIYDLESLKRGASACDAVIHTAFNHDFSKFKENCETDRGVIRALGEALMGTKKPLVVTSGLGIVRKQGVVDETDPGPSSDVMPRGATEEAMHEVAAKGVDVYVVRLPPTTHGAGDHGFVPMVIDMARAKGESVYINDGSNLWPAVHRFDAALLYRLAIERRPSLKIFHAVAEAGVAFRSIAEAIAKGLHVPAVSKTPEEGAKHFTWFNHFANMNCRASAEATRKALNWEPKDATLMEDLLSGSYFK